MCLALPVKVIKIDKDKAIVNHDDIEREIDTVLIPNVKIGDYILAHANLGINILSKDEAKKIIALNSQCSHED